MSVGTARALVALCLVGCSSTRCTVDPAPEPELALSSETTDVSPDCVHATWPEAVTAGVGEPSRATRVEICRAGFTVDNAILLATWPAGVLARVQGEAGSDRADDWPRVAVGPSVLTIDGAASPNLRAALEEARRAESSASGAGSGALVIDFRIADDVPFETLERALLSAGMAGYARPRFVVADDGGGDRAVAWPRASAPTNRMSEAEIAAVLAARGEPAAVPQDDSPTVVPDPPPIAAPAGMRTRVDGELATIEVSADVPFARLSPVLQQAIAMYDAVRVVSTRAAR